MTLAEIASKPALSEADARARRALILNREKAWSAYWNAQVPNDSMPDEVRISVAERRDEYLKAHTDACAALRAFDARAGR